MENKQYNKLKASFEASQPQLPADFTERVMRQIEEQQSVSQPKSRRVWLYSAIGAVAASIALLLYVGIVPSTQHGGEPDLMAQTDTIKTTPQIETKKVEEQPLEMADTVKKVKEKIRMPRTPKHYMAKAEPTEITPEPEPIDAVELAERAFAEEERRMAMEMMAEMNGNLQADFKAITEEIRSRGERMTQQVEIAMSDEDN